MSDRPLRDIRDTIRQIGTPFASFIEGSAAETPVVVVLVLPADIRRDQWKGHEIGFGHTEIHEVGELGPIARYLFQFFPDDETTITLEAFLNPSGTEDRALLQHLAESNKPNSTHTAFIRGQLLLHGYTVDGTYLGSKLLNWREQHARGAQTILDRTAHTTTVWPAAKEQWLREHPEPPTIP